MPAMRYQTTQFTFTCIGVRGFIPGKLPRIAPAV
jgi:hypothetical protein